MTTQFFRDCLMYCEFKTVDEIKLMSIEIHHRELAPIEAEIDEIVNQIAELKHRKSELEYKLIRTDTLEI